MLYYFWLLTLICCTYAAGWGGNVGRWGVALFVSTALATVAADRLTGGPVSSRVLPLLCVDFAYLGCLYVLAVRSNRYWPIWAAGFQLIGVLTLLLPLIDPSLVPRLYRQLESFWAIPILLTMAFGISKDRQAGLVKPWKTKHVGSDADSFP